MNRARPDLLAVLAAPDGAAPSVRDGSGLLERAQVHGLSGPVQRALEAAKRRLGGELDGRLLRDARAIAGQGLRMKLLLGRVLAALREQDLSPVVLKGYPLAARCYPDPLLRPSTDVDLLVRPGELERTGAALATLGLSPQDEPARAYFREHHHHLAWQGPAGLVEVHFRLLVGFGGGIDWEDLLPPVDAVLEGLAFRRLQPADELCYLALHAAQHVFARLSWLYDLRRYLEAEPALDWGRVIALGRETGFAVPLWAALDAARDCFDAPVPSEVLEQLRPSIARAAALRTLLTPQRLHDGAFQQPRNLYAAQVLMTATANRAVRFIAHHSTRAAKRSLAARFPALLPERWRG